MCAEHLCSFCVIFIVTLSLGTLSLQDTKAQLTQVRSRARMWTFVLLAPNLCSFLRRSSPLVSSPLWATWPCWASVVPGLTHSLLHAITCRKASLPLTWLKFTVLVLLFFSNLLKSILVSQDFISNTDLSSFPPKLSSSMTPKVSPGPVARPYLLFTFSSNWPVFQAGLCWSVPSPHPCVSLALCHAPSRARWGFLFWTPLRDCPLGAPVVGMALTVRGQSARRGGHTAPGDFLDEATLRGQEHLHWGRPAFF